MSHKLLGLIAGNGRFPIAFAQKAKEFNYRVVAAGVKGDTSIFLRPFVEKLEIFKVGELQKLLDYLKNAGIKDVIMAGQVNPNNLFDPNVTLDETSRQLFEAIKDRKADTIFSAVAQKLSQNGMTLIDSTFLLKDHLAPHGTLTKRAPTLSEIEDIQFGKEIAKQMGGIDVGQTVVIKEKAIVAIEAMEGTDRTILRGGQIAQGGAVVVKMSKPNQDLRFDVPVVGPKTIQTMQKCRASCLAIEAGRTLIIDRPQTVKLADRAKITIVAA